MTAASTDELCKTSTNRMLSILNRSLKLLFCYLLTFFYYVRVRISSNKSQLEQQEQEQTMFNDLRLVKP